MKYLKFANGDSLPALGLGTWKADPGVVGTAIKTAIGLGYRHFDCAAIYGNEAEIGGALAEVIAAGEVKRSELWITSKLWNAAHAPADVLPALKKSLVDLQLEYLDLYLMHWPLAFKSGVHFPESPADTIPLADRPLATTWAAMEKLVEQGLCRHIGVANFSLAKLKALTEEAAIKPAMNQIELHPYLQQKAMLEYCQQQAILLTAYAPLGSGGRPEHLKAESEQVLLQDGEVGKIAATHKVTSAQVLLAWGLSRGTAVIPKSVNAERLAENFAATGVSLTADDVAAIDRLDRHYRFFTGSVFSFEGTDYSLASLWDGE